MKFLIQTINGKIKHDFSFTLLESIEYQNWLRNNNSFQVYFTDLKLHEMFTTQLNFYYTKILNEPLIHYTVITHNPNKTSTQNPTHVINIIF